MAEPPSPKKTYSHWDTAPATCRGRTPGAPGGRMRPVWEADSDFREVEEEWDEGDDLNDADAEALVAEEIEAESAPVLSASGLIVKPTRSAAMRSASSAGYFSTPAMRVSNGSFKK